MLLNRARTLATRFSCARASTALHLQQQRDLNIHEYQSQQLLHDHGVNVPRQSVASTVTEASAVAKGIGGDVIVKAQVLAGGRGLGHFDTGLQGGVHICHSPQEVEDVAKGMLGNRLITRQTGDEGQKVSKVLVAERHYIRREIYFCIALDRKSGGPLLLASAQGGMGIEELAATNPEALVRHAIDIHKGISDAEALDVAKQLKFNEEMQEEAADQIKKLYAMFRDLDCTQLEINPLAETATGRVMCVDAKLNFDDNAEFRHKDLFGMRDISQEDARDVAASEHDLNFIGLDGNIGCLVNGAGLAMATMDIIKLFGGSPANFLDVGGGASEQQVSEALKIIASDPKVEAILINIFGGIMRCDVIALGILNAVQNLKLQIPLVVRLQGTNVEEAKQLLNSSGLRIIPADDLDDAAERAVKVADIVSMAKKAALNVHFELPL
eukprot:TRINITY_DN26293_c0_g1_i1.p1 TRINITY_DN26293_c0_g1~~TRINITY_DN26293_c0_g1_i1.p1  ORF type:complete len:440 (+),score=183.04 TRINITY_DN26293_c0_g1_i1:116-1435(+)